MFLSITTFGCGPDFPNNLLNGGDDAVLCAPEAFFSKEIARMKLVAPVYRAKPTTHPPGQSLEAELGDLTQALEQSRGSAETREAILGRYVQERQKINLSAGELLRPDPTNVTRIPGPLPVVVTGLPGEFADYFRGAIGWHQCKMQAARAAWESLLKRPPSDRHFKSTWAAFMLGRSWEEENRRRAIAYFQQVRALAKAGFADSLGLASASLGFEARLLLRENRFAPAIELYLEQAAEGEPSAYSSLRWAAEQALPAGASVLSSLAAHPRAQRVITAYVIAGGWASPPIDVDCAAKEASLNLMQKASGALSFLPAPKLAWHTFQAPVLIWLEAVEAAKVQDVDSAEQLALAAYQAGKMEIAQRWLGRARATPVAQWLKAKLLLRDGRVDDAAALLAQLCRAFPSEPTGTNSSAGLADSLFLSDGAYSTISMARQAKGELGVLNLARRQYTESLDALLQSGYWMDAAYVAERVLTIEELKSHVDRRWPAETRAVESAQAELNAPLLPDSLLPRSEASTSQQIRYLLARRLARANRRGEALGYYPAEWRPAFVELTAALNEAEKLDLAKEKRARAYFAAAKITRELGLELVGTEVEPDWRIHSGDFEGGVTVSDRANSRGTNAVGASDEELRRAMTHATNPELRWHYRYVAPTLAIQGARLMRDAEMPGLSKAERAQTLFEAAKLVHRFDGYASCAEDAVPSPRDEGAGAITADNGPLLPGPLFPRREERESAGSERGQRRDTPPLVDCYPSAILAWEAGRLMPNNSEDTARVLCVGGSWIKVLDPKAADVFYKALVRRCRNTAIGAEADRLRWFPILDENGNLRSSR